MAFSKAPQPVSHQARNLSVHRTMPQLTEPHQPGPTVPISQETVREVKLAEMQPQVTPKPLALTLELFRTL